MIGFITLTPAGSILDSAGRAPELFINPNAIGAMRRHGTSTEITLFGGTFVVQESIEQIHAAMLEAAGIVLEQEGRCQECGCTDSQACQDPRTGEPCHWANRAHTLCSACAIPIVEDEP